MTKLKPTKNIEIKTQKKISQLLVEMSDTGFQGRKLGEVFNVLVNMIKDPEVTIFFGIAGAMAVSGQAKIIKWLIKNNFVDVLVPTGANICEDIVQAVGRNYYKGDHRTNDEELFRLGYNRYYDVYGKEKDYLYMTELIANFYLTLNDSQTYSSRWLLYKLGEYLFERNINCILSEAYSKNLPVFCPAIIDSPLGDALLISKTKGKKITIDCTEDYIEFMSLNNIIKDTGILVVGGGVPKDFIQLFSVTGSLLYNERRVPNRKSKKGREKINEGYYPHKYAIQITTDSPQWGGLSGCTFEEATSWGKESGKNENVQCFCDATIALPIITQGLSEIKINRKAKNLINSLVNN